MSTPSISRHDLLLGTIAVSLVVAAVVGTVFPVGLPVALIAGAVPATGSMGYGLFYRPPSVGAQTTGEN